MKIIVFGARGDVGSRVVAEALSRGHAVTGVVRNGEQAQDLPSSASAAVADVADTDRVAALMADHDLAISAIRPPDGKEPLLVPLTQSLLDAAAESRSRILVVGGAASLKLPDGNGETVLTAPGFLPDAVRPIALACQAQYELVTSDNRMDWAYLCPPGMLSPGTRTGTYRTGSDTLVVAEDGTSSISMEDFAVALIDEAETPQHTRTRFTVGA